MENQPVSDKYSERRGINVQYHEVKINLELRDAKDCYWSGTHDGTSWATNMTSSVASVPSLDSCSLYVDYVFLDTEERRRFAQLSHEYLIEQLQFTGDESTNTQSNKVKLNFNHPTKSLVWVVQPDEFLTDKATTFGKQWFNYTDADENNTESSVFAGAAGGAGALSQTAIFGAGENPVRLAKLQLNGHDRFSERDGRYFNLVQPYQHFENVPAKGINVYSFALKPEDHQPSGTCNMSRIDNATLHLTLTENTVKTPTNNTRSAKVKIFALSYNVLRVMSGMGGMAYAN